MDNENIEEKAASEGNSTEPFSSNENVSNEKSVTFKKENQSQRSKKDGDSEANSTVSAEEILDLEVGKLKQQDAVDKVKPEVEPKLEKEKKRSPKKRTEKKVLENSDAKEKEDTEENSKQKRKGWWSLKG